MLALIEIKFIHSFNKKQQQAQLQLTAPTILPEPEVDDLRRKTRVSSRIWTRLPELFAKGKLLGEEGAIRRESGAGVGTTMCGSGVDRTIRLVVDGDKG